VVFCLLLVLAQRRLHLPGTPQLIFPSPAGAEIFNSTTESSENRTNN